MPESDPADVVSLRGRECEERVVALLAMAQIHRDPEDALARAPRIAQDYATAPHLELWGLERDGELLAVAGIEPAHPDGLYLHDLAVWPSARGSGLGRQLVDWLRCRFPATTIHGETLEQAAGFYSALGFEVHENGSPLANGEPVYRFTLAREVTATMAT